MSSIERQVKELLVSQKSDWQVARDNYAALGKVQTRVLGVDREVCLQFNPARIRSSAAKVDNASLKVRPCFLCHRPEEQKSIVYNDDFEILINPYPIFEEHLTIPLRKHERQQIRLYFNTLLDLAAALPSFALFYNGPKCGASAPDHMHFQAGVREGFPFIRDWNRFPKEMVWEGENTVLYVTKDSFPVAFSLVSTKREEAVALFERLYECMEVNADEYEPRMNLLTWWEDDTWKVCVYPRKALRPSCYYAKGDANILISPATVEMSGLFIVPLEKDFQKVTLLDLQTIWQEVSITGEEQVEIIRKLINT